MANRQSLSVEEKATINLGRITGVKNNVSIVPASPEEVAFFKRKQRNFDPVTGLTF
jgi:hypothetical protein